MVPTLPGFLVTTSISFRKDLGMSLY